MNANRIINMVLRRAMNKGIRLGIDKVAGGGKAAQDMTPEERHKANKARKATQNAQRGMKTFRRMF